MEYITIVNDETYQQAINQLETLFNQKLSHEENLYIKQLTNMISLYETEVLCPELSEEILSERVTPIDVIQFHMEQQNKTESDMKQYFGSATKTSEVLSGKRPLTMKMINKLHEGMHIPKELLIN